MKKTKYSTEGWDLIENENQEKLDSICNGLEKLTSPKSYYEKHNGVKFYRFLN